VTYTTGDGSLHTLSCKNVITTTGAYALPGLLPFIKTKDMNKISNLYYAPIIQVSVGIRNKKRTLRPSFGGLVPSCEKMPILGILFPSDCFQGRAPEGGFLYSFFIGGVHNTQALKMTDKEITNLVKEMMYKMLGYDKSVQPEMIHISRHTKAIPQYEISSGERFETIEKLQSEYPGLILAGNIKGGIGMADRIKQALQIAEKG
jgi:oxygen-dependent protoporphyrinogen oxidase